MHHGWITTMSTPERPEVQISPMTRDATHRWSPRASIEVEDVDEAYRLARMSGAGIVPPLTDEPSADQIGAYGDSGDSPCAIRTATW